MVDPIDAAAHEPTLSEVDEHRVEVKLAQRRRIESLMASEDMPDIDELVEQFVNRPWWHRWAACRGLGSELFFPERGTGRPLEALAYCDECRVRQQCLAEALSHADHYAQGVWGGTSGRERRQMRRCTA